MEKAQLNEKFMEDNLLQLRNTVFMFRDRAEYEAAPRNRKIKVKKQDYGNKWRGRVDQIELIAILEKGFGLKASKVMEKIDRPALAAEGFRIDELKSE